MTQFEELEGTQPVTIEVGAGHDGREGHLTAYIVFWPTATHLIAMAGTPYFLEEAGRLSGLSRERVDEFVEKWWQMAALIQAAYLVDDIIYEQEAA